MDDSGYTMDDSGYTMDDSGYTMDDSGYTMDDSGYTMDDALYIMCTIHNLCSYCHSSILNERVYHKINPYSVVVSSLYICD